MVGYLDVLSQRPALAQFVLGNMKITARRFRAAGSASDQRRIAVSSWSLGHNPVGRAMVLADLYAGMDSVELIGTLVPRHGRELWAPLRDAGRVVHGFELQEMESFMGRALKLVAAHPYHRVHLSKPRLPNIIIGLLYRLIWEAQVLVDVDDDEMAFFPDYSGGESRLNGGAGLELPASRDLVGPGWTALGLACSGLFDAVTVSNPVLQDRFGGTILRHARSETDFDPARHPQVAVRRRYNIGENERLVLFLGTPRAHKGLLEVAAALDALGQPNVTFLVVGSFPRGEEALRDRLRAFPNLRCRLLPDQPFARVPELVALADIGLALQNPDSAVTVAQVPAKLTDALAMGRLAIVSQNPALRDLPLADHALVTDWHHLQDILARALASLPESEDRKQARRELFLREFSVAANRQRLQAVLADLPGAPDPVLVPVMERVLTHLPGFRRALLGLRGV